MWVQDEYALGSVKLLRETCKNEGVEMIEVSLDQAYPIDLEELFSGLSAEGGVICLREADTAHEHMGTLIYAALMYYEFRRSSLSKSVRIPDNWKFVMVTPPSFRIPDRALYRRLLKLVNPREAICLN